MITIIFINMSFLFILIFILMYVFINISNYSIINNKTQVTVTKYSAFNVSLQLELGHINEAAAKTVMRQDQEHLFQDCVDLFQLLEAHKHTCTLQQFCNILLNVKWQEGKKSYSKKSFSKQEPSFFLEGFGVFTWLTLTRNHISFTPFG